MLSEFEKKVAEFVKANGLFASTEKILLAVSGGADSTALMHAMCALRGEGAMHARLLCAHINHQLRQDEALADEDFVAAEAAKLKLPVVTERLDVRGFAGKNKMSIETAARNLRIKSLLDIAKANNCACVATGHQKNDNAETVLHRLLRGTGFRGLAGIWPVRTFKEGIRFTRPLLCVGRKDITSYLRGKNLKWREDRTNIDCGYTRNYIRHRLLPVLQQDCSVSLVEQLSRLAESARKFHLLVCGRTDAAWVKMAKVSGDAVVLSIKTFLPEAEPVKVELIRRALVTLGCGERNLIQEHYRRILRLAAKNVGAKVVELPRGFAAHHEYDSLILRRTGQGRCPDAQMRESVELSIPGQTKFGRYLIEAKVLETGKRGAEVFETIKTGFIENFDMDRVTPPVMVRFRQVGDKFHPLGLAGEKKVGKFLTAARLPARNRREVLIVADSKKIIWVCPVRMSEQAKVTGETSRILRLQVTESEAT